MAQPIRCFQRMYLNYPSKKGRKLWRRLNKEDLESSNPVLSQGESHGYDSSWRVYEDYEVLSSDDGSTEYVQAVAREGSQEPECIKVYDPLIDTPYLFLEFARIVESKDPEQSFWDWILKYGLLGQTYRNPEYDRTRFTPNIRYDPRGGPKDTVESMWEAAYEANEALNLYEAALSRDKVKLKKAILLASKEEMDDRWTIARAETLDSYPTELLTKVAIRNVIDFTTYFVEQFAYPTLGWRGLNSRGPESAPTLNGLTRDWGYRNLIGAMCLQFYWLITSGSDISRCKYCNRVITYTPPQGHDGRKPRKDKEFCDSRCRQNYHYHNKIKPNRSGKS